MRRFLSPARLAVAGLLLLAAVAAVLFVVPADATYIVLPDRARPVEPLVKVEGGERPRGPGGIYLVDVRVRRATLLERLLPPLRAGASLVPDDVINPAGVSDEERIQANLREMTRSQQIAAAVALRSLGYRVRTRSTGVLVDSVLADAPAEGRLAPGDVIVSLDGRRVPTPAALRRRLGNRKPGDAVTLGVRRGTEVKRIRVRTGRDPDDLGRAVLGVLVTHGVDIDLPISVEIDAGPIGGPSAGLAFALDVLEELGRDVDRGRKVAVTGALDIDGSVEPVGGVAQKVIGARRTGVDVFLVPAGDNAEEARRNADGLRIVPVRSFQHALRALQTTDVSQQD